VTFAILGPGGVGGLIGGALERAGEQVVIVARESTAELIGSQGLRINSVTLGDFIAHPRAAVALDRPADVLIVATKAPAMEGALERIEAAPKLVLPLLNG